MDEFITNTNERTMSPSQPINTISGIPDLSSCIIIRKYPFETDGDQIQDRRRFYFMTIYKSMIREYEGFTY